MVADPDPVVQATRTWLERAVIGLNLCPFARAEYERDRIRFAVSAAVTEGELLKDLRRELLALSQADPARCETTLLIHPGVLSDFLDYNQFLDRADRLLRQCGLEGELQIASFHPQYQFAGSAGEDVENCTNRSPWPMLHLLREASLTRVLEAWPGDPAEIVERNLQTMRRLGPDGWRALLAAP